MDAALSSPAAVFQLHSQLGMTTLAHGLGFSMSWRSVEAYEALDFGSRRAEDWYSDVYSVDDPSDAQKATRITSRISDISSQLRVPVDYTRKLVPLFASVRPQIQHLLPTHHSLSEALRALQCPIATTNYDMLLEETLGRDECNLLHLFHHKSQQTITPLSQVQQLGAIRPPRCSTSPVYHLHGVWFDSKSFVLNHQEYHSHLSSFFSAMLSLLQSLTSSDSLSCKSILFIGCGEGLFDSHFLSCLRELARRFPNTQHYVLVADDPTALQPRLDSV